MDGQFQELMEGLVSFLLGDIPSGELLVNGVGHLTGQVGRTKKKPSFSTAILHKCAGPCSPGAGSCW